MSSLRIFRSRVGFLLFLLGIFWFAGSAALQAQTGNAGTIAGVVKDPSGAAIPGADVTIANPVSGYQREMKTDAMEQFRFPQHPLQSLSPCRHSYRVYVLHPRRRCQLPGSRHAGNQT